MIELNEKSKITCALVTVPFDIKTYDLFPTSQHDIIRSSCPEIFFRKGVLINFAKFTGKHLRQSLFFNQVDQRFATLLKKKTLAQVFSCNFYEISKNTFFTEHLRLLLLIISLYYSESKEYNKLLYSHKKRKGSLETRVKAAVLCVYSENQAILEPIFLYRALKCKQI